MKSILDFLLWLEPWNWILLVLVVGFAILMGAVMILELVVLFDLLRQLVQ